MTSDRTLVVDLDGTLVRSNLLLESFWSSFAKSWRTPFEALQALREGRAKLKHKMNDLAEIDADALPYNPAVLDYITTWRSGGGRTALVTAANRHVAERIAGHLGIFDEVHGSDETTNLKGKAKALFLSKHFGDNAFDYIGDADADIPVWQKSHRAIIVDESQRLRNRLARIHSDIVSLKSDPSDARDYLRACRPHQWLKNLLIFLPLLASHNITASGLLAAALAFVSFSLVASGVYVLNDLLDLGSDRAHPRKRNRPFASGAVPIEHGTLMAPLLALAGFLLGLPLGAEFVTALSVYYMATLAYSLHLKRKPVIDICTLAGLYTIRIVAGGLATGTPLSIWLLAFSVFLFFSLAAVKRQAELVDMAASAGAAKTGRDYQVSDLGLITSMATAAGYMSIIVLGLYITSPDVLVLYSNPQLLWGVCAILFYWINRIVMLTHRGQMHDDPVIFAVTDRTSLSCFGLALLVAFCGSLS